MKQSFADDAEWVASSVIAARLEQAALVRLLVKNKLISQEEYLQELNQIVGDDFPLSVRQFVQESEQHLRNSRWHVGGAAATDQLGRRLALRPTDRILDVGCGIGGPARQIAETFGCQVLGVDIRLERVIEATLRTAALGLISRVAFQVAEGERLPFEDGSFDVVISQAAWNWVPDKLGLVREAYRVLKPNGLLGVECEALTEKGRIDESESPGSLFRILAWQQLMGAAGFEEIQIQEMWEESQQFYPSGPEREQIDRGERVSVRMVAQRPARRE